MTDDPTPTLVPGVKFRYPADGWVYEVLSVDEAKMKIVLERGKSAGEGGIIPWFKEAAPFYVTEKVPDEKAGRGATRVVKYRCCLTEEIEEDGKFLRAKYYKQALLP